MQPVHCGATLVAWLGSKSADVRAGDWHRDEESSKNKNERQDEFEEEEIDRFGRSSAADLIGVCTRSCLH